MLKEILYSKLFRTTLFLSWLILMFRIHDFRSPHIWGVGVVLKDNSKLRFSFIALKINSSNFFGGLYVFLTLE